MINATATGVGTKRGFTHTQVHTGPNGGKPHVAPRRADTPKAGPAGKRRPAQAPGIQTGSRRADQPGVDPPDGPAGRRRRGTSAGATRSVRRTAAQRGRSIRQLSGAAGKEGAAS